MPIELMAKILKIVFLQNYECYNTKNYLLNYK